VFAAHPLTRLTLTLFIAYLCALWNESLEHKDKAALGNSPSRPDPVLLLGFAFSLYYL
jgi:hypothetical protein